MWTRRDLNPNHRLAKAEFYQIILQAQYKNDMIKTTLKFIYFL